MSVEIAIETLSVQDKIELMDRLWESLSKSPNEIPSPAWHAAVLAARKAKLESGESKPIPWEEAKRDILEYGK